tara:strand:+ start:12604 stop:13218 length:615 start_codon:yes stop_codon:yes gene_type:complete
MKEPKKYSMFPVEVLEYQNPVETYNDVIESLRTETFRSHEAFSSIRDIHEDPKYTDSFEFIAQCLEDYRVRLGYDCDKFEVNSSWCNYSEPRSGQGHQFHRHSMSFLSGVYYFTHGAPIGFEDPMTPRTMNQLEVLRKDGYMPFHYIDPCPGKLILFPSWLYHWTKPHADDFERWNISFNVLPTGKINFNMATDSTAIIKLGKL